MIFRGEGLHSLYNFYKVLLYASNSASALSGISTLRILFDLYTCTLVLGGVSLDEVLGMTLEC